MNRLDYAVILTATALWFGSMAWLRQQGLLP